MFAEHLIAVQFCSGVQKNSLWLITMDKSFSAIEEAKKFRRKGYSFEEIGKQFAVAKSTAFYWTNSIVLNKKAKERIRFRERRGLKKAKIILKEKREKLLVVSIRKQQII